MTSDRGALRHPRTFWVLVLLIVVGSVVFAVYPGGATATSLFQSPPTPESPVDTPTPTFTRPVTQSPTPTTQLTPTRAVATSTRIPTLAPPTLVPSPLPTRTPTLPPTATRTPTEIPPAAKTATAAARSYLPPPTLTSPGILPPGGLAPVDRAPLSGPTLTPLPQRTDPPTPRPQQGTSGLVQFFDDNLLFVGLIGICWSVLALAGIAVAAIWVLRKKT